MFSFYTCGMGAHAVGQFADTLAAVSIDKIGAVKGKMK
jgi:hypothetical protein